MDEAAAGQLGPTVLVNVAADSPVMQEEIFGRFSRFLSRPCHEAIDFVNARTSPLGMHLFAADRSATGHIFASTYHGEWG